eukprot:7330919-Lingulodinium_polyedra.AAC.1
MMRGMLRNGGDPRRWLGLFLREKSIQSSERVVHELKTVTESLYHFGVTDQVNVGGRDPVPQ